MSDMVTGEEIKEVVREAYGGIARRYVEENVAAPTQASCCGPSRTTLEDTPQAACCGPSGAVAEEPTQAACCGLSRATLEAISQAACCGPSGAVVGEETRAACCGPSSETLEDMVQASCCAPSEKVVEEAGTGGATRFYSVAELANLPVSVTDVSLGCGNPTAIAALQPGEVVLDLGSGGGIDCFIAAGKVGPEGRVIGLDMTPDMIRLARRNAKKVGLANVEFRYGEMEDIPLPDESVDVIISNCVINLSPDKDAVFGEAFRVLRPGGRMTVSDIVIDGDLPRSIRSRLDAWAGCIAGALDESVYLDKIRAAGFTEVDVLSRRHATTEEVADVAAADGEPQMVVVGSDGQVIEGEEAQALLDEAGISSHDLAEKIASVNVTALKPA
jgi:arsenite methyltransferase